MTKSANQIEHGTISFGVAPDATLVVRFSGSWHLDRDLPPSTELIPVLDARPTAKRISFDTTALADWDSGLLSFLTETDELCRNRGIVADRAGLPTGLRRLLELAEAVPEKKGTQAAAKRESFFARVGNSTLAAEASAREFLSFVGQLTIAFGNLLRGRARYRSVGFDRSYPAMRRERGRHRNPDSFLVGVILAFMGAVQLSQFGAAIYVADLVGIGMVREMGAMMTAIIMSGRTGAAFAAKLGTMKVTRGDRRAHNHGHLAAGVSGFAASARTGPHDAAAMLCMRTSSEFWADCSSGLRCSASLLAHTCGKPFRP